MSHHSIMLLDTEPSTSNYYITLAIADALRRNPRVKRVVLASHADAITWLQTKDIEIFLAFGGAERHVDFLARLCSLAKLSILWTTEDPYQLAGNVNASICFDLVFSNDRSSVPAYGGRARHLPLAASPLFQDFPVNVDDNKFIYDLLFIGTAWPNRVKSLNRIAAAFDNRLKIKLALPYNEFIGPPDLDDSSMITEWRCGNKDFARFANQSRIVLTLPRHFSASGATQAVGSTPPPRLFETALAGTAQILIGPPDETVNYFEIGSEIELCEAEDEAINKIRMLIGDPSSRMRLARNAKARAQRDHLYANRIDEIIAAAETHSEANKAFAQPNARKVLLYVTHNRVGNLPGSGVEFYQERLATALDEYDIIFFFPTIRDGSKTICVQGNDFSFEVAANSMDRELLSDSGIEGLFEKVLIERKIDLVHFHHLIYLPLSLPIIARALGMPTLWQVHDYYLICDRYNLITIDNRFCDVVNNGREQCDGCLVSLDKRPPGTKTRRDNLNVLLASTFDAVVASTRFSADYISAYFNEIDKSRIHQFELPLMQAPLRSSEVQDDAVKRFKIAIPGNFNTVKGAEYLADLISLCRDCPYEFHILGYVDDRFRQRFSTLPDGCVIITDGYEAKDALHILSACNIALHLSIWPETYMLSLSESWASGLVPIVTNLGGPADRVTNGVDGFVVRPNNITDVFESLQQLHFDRTLFEKVRKNVRAKPIVSITQHVDRMRDLYRQLIAKRALCHNRVPALTSRIHSFDLFDAGIRLNSPRWSTRDNYWDGFIPAPEQPQLKAPLAKETSFTAAEGKLKQTRVDGKTPRSYFYFDDVSLDGLPVKFDSASVIINTLFIRGWMIGRHPSTIQRTLIRFRGSHRSKLFELDIDNRPDVSKALQVDRDLRCGFKNIIQMTGLEDGLYDLDFIQVTADRVYERRSVYRCAVALKGLGRFSQVPNWKASRAVDNGAVRPLLGGRVVIENHNLQTKNSTLEGLSDDSLWLEGAGLPRSVAISNAIAVLKLPNDSSYEAPVLSHSGDKLGGFAISGRLDALPPGIYELSIVCSENGTVSTYESGVRISIVTVRSMQPRARVLSELQNIFR